jgi:hypothetical protein
LIPSICFLSVYRFLALSLLRGGVDNLQEASLCGAALLVIIYAVVEILAVLPLPYSQIFDYPRTCCHVGYAVLILALVTHALVAHTGIRRVQEAAVGFLALIAAGSTIFSEVYSRVDASTLPLLIDQSSHVLTAIVFLFLQNATEAGAEIARTKLVPYDGDDGALDVDSDDDAEEDALG